MYHDVVDSIAHESSGFPGTDAALYKLDPRQFAAHLSALATVLSRPPWTVDELSDAAKGETPFMITFDDGGVSAHTCIADQLEARGWRGHFFVTAGRIGAYGFLNPDQIRDLRRRGHIVGSHSFSHPLRMAQLSREDLVGEWNKSTTILSDIVGEKVTVASIPGGQYAPKIADAASQAGIRSLFSSEPVTRLLKIDLCTIYGRYTIQRWTPPRVAAEMAAGKIAPRVRQLVWWNAKKATKALGGEYYLKVRRTLLGQE
jgi:peptidoglycan/xylan/chitin deacetylase (PgdA/CDA1 family)